MKQIQKRIDFTKELQSQERDLWASNKQITQIQNATTNNDQISLDIDDYGEEEKFIKTVDDDVLDNKYSIRTHEEEPAFKDNIEEIVDSLLDNKEELRSSDSGTTITSPIGEIQLSNKKIKRVQTPAKKGTPKRIKQSNPNKESYISTINQASTINPSLFSSRNIKHSKRKKTASINDRNSSLITRKSPMLEKQERQLKVRRQNAYFDQCVKPLHKKQTNLKQRREQLYRQLIIRAQQYKLSQQQSKTSVLDSNNMINFSPQSRTQQEKQIRSIKISDYYKRKQLRSSSNGPDTTTPQYSMNNKDFSNLSEKLIQQSSNLGIFNTESNNLKKEFIDTEKAISLMNRLKINSSLNQSVENDVQKENIIIKEQESTEHKSDRKQQWNEFLSFMKQNPKSMLDLVPSSNVSKPQKTIDYQTLSQYSSVNFSSAQRPNSSYNKIASYWQKLYPQQKRDIESEERLRGDYGKESSSLSMINSIKNRRIKTSHNYYRPKSYLRQANVSSQYSTMNSNNQVDNSSSKNFLQMKQHDSDYHHSIEQQDTSSQKIQSMQKDLVDPCEQKQNKTQTNFYQNVHSNQVNMKIDKSKGLLGKMKFPINVQQQNGNITKNFDNKQSFKKIDFSTKSLQKSVNIRISAYERANERLKYLEALKAKRKPLYSLANDLAKQYNVDEWKKNPNFHRFTRQINSQQPIRKPKLIDWKESQLKKNLEQNKPIFNSENDTKIYAEDEVEYMINVLRYSSKDFSTIDMLKPVFNKSLNTLEKVMEELMLGHVYDKIQLKIIDINIENTMKILLRCKMMFQCRHELINILQIIDLREIKLKELNYIVIQGGDQQQNKVNQKSQQKFEREKILKEKVRELSEITQIFVRKVRDLFSLRKVFGSIFVYDKMDYLKVVVNEVRQLKDMLQMFGIDMTTDYAINADQSIQVQQNEVSIFDDSKFEKTMIDEISITDQLIKNTIKQL